MKVSDIESNAPIRTADNKFGTVIQFGDDDIGIQIPGEEDIRWIPIDRVTIVGNNALQESIAMDKQELKPSPLTGEPAVFESRLLQEIVHYRVRSGSLKTSWHTSKKLAATAWNQRLIEDALKAENERLREVVKSLIDLHKVTLNEVKCGFSGYAGSVHYTEIIEAAKQALKEQL